MKMGLLYPLPGFILYLLLALVNVSALNHQIMTRTSHCSLPQRMIQHNPTFHSLSRNHIAFSNKIPLQMSSSSSISSDMMIEPKKSSIFTPTTHQWPQISSKIKNFLNMVMMISIPIMLVVLTYSIAPAFARDIAYKSTNRIKSKLAGSSGGMAKKKAPSFLKKLLEGANTTGSFRKWKAGDTRKEFAVLINAFSSVIWLGGIATYAYILFKFKEHRQHRAQIKELSKIGEYKENMYFDAVQEILTKLADDRMKPTLKTRLQRELKELDPDGVIQKFVQEGGERPDLSNIVGAPVKRKSSQPLRKPGNKPLSNLIDNNKKMTRNQSTDDDDDEQDYYIDDRQKTPNNIINKNQAPVSNRNNNIKDSRSNNKNDDNMKVLTTLSESLEEVLSTGDRRRLVEYLSKRLDAIKDPVKQEGATAKIAERLGEEEYWKDFYDTKVKNN